MMTFRSSRIIYYGPHACERCGRMICKMALENGGNAFDYPDGPIYPNTEWHPHVCDPDTPKTENSARATLRMDPPTGSVKIPEVDTNTPIDKAVFGDAQCQITLTLTKQGPSQMMIETFFEPDNPYHMWPADHYERMQGALKGLLQQMEDGTV